MMEDKQNKNQQDSRDLREEAKIDGKLPGRNISENMDIEQTRIEHRREADLDDKTPSGDGGPEDAGTDEANGGPGAGY